MTVTIKSGGTNRTITRIRVQSESLRLIQRIKIMAAGVLRTVYDITFSVNPSIASLSGSRLGAGVVNTSSSTTANVTGGVGPFTYAWTRQSGSVAITATAPSSATTSFTATVAVADSFTAVFICTVTDTATGIINVSGTVSVNLLETT
jgi:hypothetical protein